MIKLIDILWVLISFIVSLGTIMRLVDYLTDWRKKNINKLVITSLIIISLVILLTYLILIL